MRIVLDTNVLIRFFTKDIVSQAEKVKELLESGKNLYIPEVVFPELEYILTEYYSISKEELVKIYGFLTSHPHIKTTPQLKKAVILFEQTNIGMADCIIAACSAKGKLASFDKNLLNAEGVKSFWK